MGLRPLARSRLQPQKRPAGSPFSFRGKSRPFVPRVTAYVSCTVVLAACALLLCFLLRKLMVDQVRLSRHWVIGRPGGSRCAALFAHLPYAPLTASILTRARAM